MTERNQYFLACHPQNVSVLIEDMIDGAPPFWLLMANNDLNPDNEKDMTLVERALDAGTKLLIDSGVFWLTNRHKRAHGMTMDEALSLHPTEVDGFEWLLDRYVRIHNRFGERMWGMIELDQGGAERKRETRSRLHALGIHPLPVYHPLLDGWDYFDELATTHDRMCFGNIVQASAGVRERLLQTAWERKRAYPHLWIHVLGYSLNPNLHAAPIESCDSSTWKQGERWGAESDKAMLAKIGTLDRSYTYPLGDIVQHDRATRLGALISRSATHSWRDHLTRLEGVLGYDEFR